MNHLPPQCAAHIERANQLVVDESGATITRLIKLADGDLCHIRQDGKRVYYKAPDIVSLEYVINRALGTPGAKPIAGQSISGNNIEDMLSDISHEMEHMDPAADPLDPDGPLRAIIGAVAKRRTEYRQQQAALEQRVIEFLPTAIERMTELCSGVIVHREANGKTRTYTLRPNRRAIEHISRRIQGTSTPIVESLNDAELQAPDLTREYTTEDIQKMTTTQIIALVKGAEAQDQEETHSAKQTQHSSNRHPSPVYGRRAGDEGCAPAKPSTLDGHVELPVYYTAACVQMAEYLPEAIEHMKTLARGATTIIETDAGERDEINHAPDSRANQFLTDLFIGAPTSRFMIKETAQPDFTPNAEAITRYTNHIVKLCTTNPTHACKEDHVRTLLQQLTETV